MDSIKLTRHDHEATIAVHGNLVFDLNREFRDAYQAVPAKTPFVVDLAHTDYIDSAGLGMLIQLREHAGGSKSSVRLVGLNQTIKSILDVANFGRLFQMD